MSASDPKDGGGPSEEADSESRPGAVEPEGGPRVSVMNVGGEEVIVLSVPLPSLKYPEGTTGAEHEIIDMLLEGMTTKEIAVERGVSIRTVTTQLGAIYQKAGVNSQAELIAFMTEGQRED